MSAAIRKNWAPAEYPALRLSQELYGACRYAAETFGGSLSGEGAS